MATRQIGSRIPPRASKSPRDIQKGDILRLLFPWCSTIAFTVIVTAVVKIYEGKGVLTPSQTKTFNFLSIGFIIFLSTSLLVRHEETESFQQEISLIFLQETFVQIAKAFRHYLKRWFKASPADQNDIGEFDSLLHVLWLAYSSSTQRLRLICIVWLLFNLIALILPTLYSVICTLEDGRDYNGIYVRNGLAMVPNVTCYFHYKDCAPDVIVLDQLAHAYGEITLGARSTDHPDDCGNFTYIQSIIDSKKNYRYYCRRQTAAYGATFGIRFNEYNMNDTLGTYPHFTNRVITASSGPCDEYPQIGEAEPTTVGNPKTAGQNFISAFNFTYAVNSTSNGSIVIPTSALGTYGTTYIYRDNARPESAAQYGYGPRGLWMWAFRNEGKELGRTPTFYRCPVTVTPVANVTDPAHAIPDNIAREAVASIALQGQWKGTKKAPSWTQWQWYASQHTWNVPNHGISSDAGANIAEHAIVSLVEMLANNPRIPRPGTVPYLGTTLTVKWQYFVALTISIIAFDSVVSVIGLVMIFKGPPGSGSGSESGRWTEFQTEDTEHLRQTGH